ncbi:hypothetical protein VP1G_01923 [Cytospora mali]|uniref:Uncharacterized protein n=1 Tax=Cytospora mali TaxID=578113 RepID=A0A194US86_CYTMA|nr:hypothetical protein VP1G_01923 [Valsa mali var. pyri (nom. inval.)]
MAPFLIDPVSTLILPTKRKISHLHHTTTTHSTSNNKLSKTVIIVIIAAVAVLVLALVVFLIIRKRKKSNNNRNTMGGGGLMRGTTFPGYSTDASGGLYGGTPGAYAGGAEGMEEKHAMGYGGEHGSSGGVGGSAGVGGPDYGRSSMGGYRGVDSGAGYGGGGGGGEAAGYYATSGYGRHSQDPQRAEYGMVASDDIQRPPMAFRPYPERI